VGLLLFASLLLWAGPVATAQRLASLDGPFVALYAALIALSYVWRAVRFRLLIGRKAGLSTLYGVVSVHTLAVNLLPAAGGDLLYPLLLKRCGISGSIVQGVPSILVARGQDLLLTAILLLVSLVWLGGAAAMAGVAVAIAGVLAASGITGIALVAGPAVSRRLVRWRQGVLGSVLSGIREIGARMLMASFAVTMVARLTAIVGTFYLFQGARLDLSVAQVFAICNFYVLLGLLPLNTPAGLGVTEAFLFAVFVGSGVEQTLAAAASIEIHILQLAVAVLLGAGGVVQLTWTGRIVARAT
jgi:glycosyltransferase 2 family protein